MSLANVSVSHFIYNREKSHGTEDHLRCNFKRKMCTHLACIAGILPLNPHYEFSRKTSDKQQRESPLIYIVW